MRIRETLRRGGLALRNFLSGFLGLPGNPGGVVARDVASARQTLAERSTRRRSCC